MLRTTTGVTAQAKRALSAAAVAGVAGLSLSPGLAQAEEAAIATALVTEVSPLQVTGAETELSSPKQPQSLLDTPQTISVVPAKVIRQQGATTLRDVLRNVPGISIQAGEGGTPNGDQLTLRGFSARTDFFIDGVRDIGGYTRDPFNLEQVEVAKGPASAYTGRGSTGGSINQVSKRPHLADFGSLDVSAGTDAFMRATLDVNRVVDASAGAAVRLNLMTHSADTPRRDHVENSRWGVAPSFALGLGTPTRIVLSHLHMSQDNTPDYGIPWVRDDNTILTDFTNQPAPVDLSNWYGLAARDFEDITANVTTLAVEHDFSPAARITNTFRGGEVDRKSIVSAPRFESTGSTDIGAHGKVRDSVDSILTNHTNLTLRLGAGPVRHTVVAGLELTREEYVNRPFAISDGVPTDLYDPDPYRAYTALPYAPAPTQRAVGDTVAVYAFDTIELGERWLLSGGLRHDRFDLEYDSGTALFARVDEMTSSRVAVTYKPTPSASIYAGYATSFNPSAEGLTLSDSTAPLEPEKTRTMELGFKWALPHPRLTLTSAIFRTEKTNARTDGLPGDPPTVLEGEQRVDGFEAGVTGLLAPGWSLTAAYTWLDGEIVASNDPAELGKRTPNTPDHSFSLWTAYEVSRLTLGGGLSYVGERFSNATNARMADGYWVADAMAAYRFTDNASVRVNVYNLADEAYFDNIGGGHLIPGVGRWASVTLSYDF
ncbi:MAG TPA: TonB-dependent siderophore receptor [Caulobacteraceae bacterium]|nr:TonB-dependent siderophore receptor [Caulobacteraceae bacterium]